MEEKQVKVIQSTEDIVPTTLRSRYLKFACITVVVILLITGAYFGIKALTTDRNEKLANTINNLQHKGSCSQGLKQLAAQEPDITSTHSPYNRTTQEQALNYLVNCEFVAGQAQQALKYADQLDKLYAQDNNTGKRAQLEQLVTYIKRYQQ